MFRRLEAFQNESIESNPHTGFVESQNVFFNAVPNVFPSNIPVKGFNQAIQSVDPRLKTYTESVITQPDDIFMNDKSPSLNSISKQCQTSSLDELIGSQNPNDPIRCGWLYTPPAKGSPYPQVAQGFIGDNNGPLSHFNPPTFQKYFYNLSDAKKQQLTDICKSLKNCTDVDQAVYQGICGFCTDTNQGIPINGSGAALYNNSPATTCTTTSIVTTGTKCPLPASAPGPTPIVDKTCEPVGNRLSARCMYNTILAGGCSDNGALALALNGNPSPKDYISAIRDLDSIKLYNKVATSPFNMDIFSQGNTTVAAALQEARSLSAAATNNPANSAIGAAARDICIKKGSMSAYNFCSDLSESAPTPIDIKCLQDLFRKLGGQATGTAYPSVQNMNMYNSMGTFGAIRKYMSDLVAGMNSTYYDKQRQAMIHVLGITPERLIKRAPYLQGVEVFWFYTIPGSVGNIAGFLKRTVEPDFVQFGANTKTIFPQIGISQYASFIQLTDVRTKNDFAAKFNILTDDGFAVAINQPVGAESVAIGKIFTSDAPGLYCNTAIQGPTTYQFNSCADFSGLHPNIMKIFWHDGGGGGHTFQMTPIVCAGQSALTAPANYSLTCEKKAPFINLEVNIATGDFADTRNPSVFAPLISAAGEIHTRSEERVNVPGKKGFVRINTLTNLIYTRDFSWSSWQTCTLAIRINTMPVKETIFGFFNGGYYANIILQPLQGDTATVNIEHNMTGDKKVESKNTTITLHIGGWYLFTVVNNGYGLNIGCVNMSEGVANGSNPSYISLQSNSPVVVQNGISGGYPDIPNSPCALVAGVKNLATSGWSGMYGTKAFNYDLAWIHYFDYVISAAEITRECAADWIFTQFPDSYNTYNTNSELF